MKSTLNEWREIIHDYSIVAALVTGAVWALFEFYITTTPAIVISSTCKSIAQADKRTFIRLKVDIKNNGTGSKEYTQDSFLKISLNNLQPTKEILSRVRNGGLDFSMLSNKGGVFGLIGEAAYSFKNSVIIQPGDVESYYFNFLLDEGIDYFSVYASTRLENGNIEEKGVYTVCSAKGEKDTLGVYEAEFPTPNYGADGHYSQQGGMHIQQQQQQPLQFQQQQSLQFQQQQQQQQQQQ